MPIIMSASTFSLTTASLFPSQFLVYCLVSCYACFHWLISMTSSVPSFVVVVLPLPPLMHSCYGVIFFWLVPLVFPDLALSYLYPLLCTPVMVLSSFGLSPQSSLILFCLVLTGVLIYCIAWYDPNPIRRMACVCNWPSMRIHVLQVVVGGDLTG